MRDVIVPASTFSFAALAAAYGERAVAVALALAGVALARTVFVDRENKKLGRRQTWRETLPLTLVAMLIAGVIVYDQDLGFSKAAFTGLGVGWAAITALDTIGRRIVDPAQDDEPVARHRYVPRYRDPVDDPDPEMSESLRRLDRVERYSDGLTKDPE